MKKILILFMAVLFAVPAFAVDKTSADYLRKKRHLSPMNPIVESVAEKAIKKSLKKGLLIVCVCRYRSVGLCVFCIPCVCIVPMEARRSCWIPGGRVP